MQKLGIKTKVKTTSLFFMVIISFLIISSCTAMDIVEDDKASFSVSRPNILLIVADDLGYSDLGVYGGEIQTPNLDQLANNGGVKFTNFNAAPTCSPTRSMIMSGTYNHLAGLGAMAEWTADNQRGQPGYEGFLNDKVVTLPTLLKESGYYTFMAGKWHLGMKPKQGPHMRGFDDSFVMLPGAGNHYSDKGLFPKLPFTPYRENGQPTKLPKDFYSTTFYTDKTISYINKSVKNSDKPFFGYIAYTAPHWPLQVPERFSEKYKGKYAKGYESVKNERLKRMDDIGITDTNSTTYKGSECNTSWNDLSEIERDRQEKRMEIYAGMVDALDENIGRVINHLKEIGEYDNTLIVFISDNGADARPPQGLNREARFLDENYNNSLDNFGKESSFTSYGGAWAEVGSTPFRMYKGTTTEGGIRVPAIIHMPGGDKNDPVISKDFASVMDLLPTFLEAAGTTHPGTIYKEREVLPISGKSMLSYLKGDVAEIHKDDLYGFSIFGRQGLQFNQWKIVRLPEPYGTDEWELYNLGVDPGETTNLANKLPEKLKEMIKRWDDFSSDTGVVISNSSNQSPKECFPQ